MIFFFFFYNKTCLNDHVMVSSRKRYHSTPLILALYFTVRRSKNCRWYYETFSLSWNLSIWENSGFKELFSRICRVKLQFSFNMFIYKLSEKAKYFCCQSLLACLPPLGCYIIYLRCFLKIWLRLKCIFLECTKWPLFSKIHSFLHP